MSVAPASAGARQASTLFISPSTLRHWSVSSGSKDSMDQSDPTAVAFMLCGDVVCCHHWRDGNHIRAQHGEIAG
jgi:hypothetical protein